MYICNYADSVHNFIFYIFDIHHIMRVTYARFQLHHERLLGRANRRSLRCRLIGKSLSDGDITIPMGI